MPLPLVVVVTEVQPRVAFFPVALRHARNDMGHNWRVKDSLIRASQAPAGYFRSYFYPSKYYGTWMVLDLLGKSRRLWEERDRAVRFLSESQNRDGSWGCPGNAYESGLALNAVLRGELNASQLQKAVAFVLDNQDSDGSWHTPIPIWEFRHKDQPIVTWQAYDSNRIVATALVLRALKRLAWPGCVSVDREPAPPISVRPSTDQ
jgi:hypothetical protein